MQTVIFPQIRLNCNLSIDLVNILVYYITIKRNTKTESEEIKMKTYSIKITGSKYNDDYFFFAPKDGEIEEEVAAIMKEMKAGNISRFTVEEVKA